MQKKILILGNSVGRAKPTDESVLQVEAIVVENLKEVVGNVLIACISLYEIEDEESTSSLQHDSRLAEMFSDETLRVHKTLLEPNFNFFKRANGVPLHNSIQLHEKDTMLCFTPFATHRI